MFSYIKRGLFYVIQQNYANADFAHLAQSYQRAILLYLKNLKCKLHQKKKFLNIKKIAKTQ